MMVSLAVNSFLQHVRPGLLLNADLLRGSRNDGYAVIHVPNASQPGEPAEILCEGAWPLQSDTNGNAGVGLP